MSSNIGDTETIIFTGSNEPHNSALSEYEPGTIQPALCAVMLWGWVSYRRRGNVWDLISLKEALSPLSPVGDICDAVNIWNDGLTGGEYDNIKF